MNKRLCIYLAIILSLMSLCGCGNIEKATEGRAPEDLSITGDLNERGKAFFDSETNLITFIDVYTRKLIPMCDKPNCQHNTTDCGAYVEGSLDKIMIDKNKRYYFLEGVLYSSDLGGGNRKKLVDTGYSNSGSYINTLLLDDKIYFMIDQTVLSENLIDSESATGIAWIDLKTNTMEVLIEIQSELESIGYCGYYENKVYGFLTKRESADEIESEYYPFYIDLETKERHEFLEGKENLDSLGIQDHYAIYTCNLFQESEPTEIYALDLDTGETIEIVKEENVWTRSYLDGKQFYGKFKNNIELGRYYYDFEKRESFQIKNETKTHLDIIAEYGEYFLGIVTFGYDPQTGQSDETKCCVISKEDYYAGRLDQYIIIE